MSMNPAPKLSSQVFGFDPDKHKVHERSGLRHEPAGAVSCNSQPEAPSWVG